MKITVLKLNLLRYSALVFLMCSFINAYGNIRLPGYLSDGLILQRDKVNTLMGWANAGEEVTVILNGNSYKTITGKNGRWEILLPRQKAGGPFNMVFKGNNEIKVSNILFGDVWICAGQSNMVLSMERVKEVYPKEISNAHYYSIRTFNVQPATSLDGPKDNLSSGKWIEANRQDVLEFSAVAYFFAKKIYDEINVPVGLINASVGGTPIEAWISKQGFEAFPGISDIIEKNKDHEYVELLKESSKTGNPDPLKDKGMLDIPKWFENTYNPKGWYNINIPGYWEDQGVRDLDGVVWYRKEFELPDSMTNVPAKLFMGRIVDADIVYINGVNVGNITYQYPPRRYNIGPGILRKGTNTIVIRVTNYAGKGGFVPDKPYFLSINGHQIDLKGTWQYKVGQVFDRSNLNEQEFSEQNQPTALYNAMVAPLTRLNIKGFLWYQGETNAWNPEPYLEYLTALIKDWRNKWQDEDLPFLYVQLANFMEVDYLPVESKWAEMRFAQLQALSIPNTAMAVAIDLGEWNDIHPLNKKDVGYRLALGALKLAYNINVVHSGPIYKSSDKHDNKIFITFTSIGSGLVSKDGEDLNRFEIAGPDGIFKWAQAKILGNKVVVWNNEIDNPVKVRYAWCDNPRGANLYNKEGLPASPFETPILKD